MSYADNTSTNNFFYKHAFVIKKILSDACVEALLYRDAPNPTSTWGEHIPPKHQRGSFRTYTKFHIPKLKM